ncbi:unnamed protein product [Parnassius apollo]|uniref:(apollo) hypothetical protein n=1 Tax=Parnassius apollo TaxID=110799 RepID=A0A8S3WH42_PARAO|nr:unnamed protein product [Parnassius apollo]
MKLFNTFSLFLLIGLAVTAPAPEKSKESKENVESKESKESGENEQITVTKDFFPDSFIVYRGKHEIVNIIVPLNSLNFNDDAKDNETSDNSNITLFFVEADVDAAGNKVYKGLYVLKDGKAKKILGNGRDAAASSDDSKDVFFGAKDGIYKYDPKKTKAVKYGTVRDSIIGIAKENATDVIYILTEDHDVYKVTEEGQKKVKIDDVVGAREIVLDNSNNLFFYGVNKKPYVVNDDGVKKIEGLPKNPNSVRLIKPPFFLENGVPFTSDNVAYLIYPNGTSERTDFDFKSNAKPSAYGMEAALIQYYGYCKNIYEYNILSLVLAGIIDDLKNFLENQAPTIQTLATQSRSSLRAH